MSETKQTETKATKKAKGAKAPTPKKQRAAKADKPVAQAAPAPETDGPTAAEAPETAEAAAEPKPVEKKRSWTRPTEETVATANDGVVEPTTEAMPPKAKKERPPKEDLVVFAFRLTQAERDAIHQTAGPRNATQFVRRIAVAFAHEDEAAFQTVLGEARSLRQ